MLRKQPKSKERWLEEDTWQVLVPVGEVMAETVKLVMGIAEVWKTALP